jgi:hypothetical protein
MLGLASFVLLFFLIAAIVILSFRKVRSGSHRKTFPSKADKNFQVRAQQKLQSVAKHINNPLIIFGLNCELGRNLYK